MSIYSFSMLTIAVVTFGLAIFVLFANRKPLLNKIFVLLLFCLAGWSSFLFLLYEYARTPQEGLIFTRSAHIAGLFTPVFLFHFTLLFFGKIREKQKTLTVVYLIAFLLLGFMTSRFFIRGITTKFGLYSPIPGIVYPFYIFFYAFLVLYSLIYYFYCYRISTGVKKVRAKYMILAILFGFGGGATAFLRPFFDLPPLHGFFIPFYASVITYAILKYRLIEISVIIRKGIIYSFLVIFITSLLVLGLFLGYEIFQKVFGVSPWLVALGISVIMVLSFPRLENLIATATDKIFFKARYDYQKALEQASRAIASVIRLDEALSLLFSVLTKTVKTKDPKIFIFDYANKKFIAKTPQKIKGILEVDPASPLIKFAKKTKTPILFEEINYRLSESSLKEEEREELKEVIKELKRIESFLIIPLVSKEEMVGFLSLGPKLSGEPFSTTDLTLLTTLANQTAIAFKNARLIEELEKSRRILKETSEVLEIRVRARTRQLREQAKVLKRENERKTKELRERLRELERFHRLTVGRELKMMELKRQIKKMEAQLKEMKLRLEKYEKTHSKAKKR